MQYINLLTYSTYSQQVHECYRRWHCMAMNIGQIRYVGRVLLSESLENLVLTGKVERQRARGHI